MLYKIKKCTAKQIKKRKLGSIGWVSDMTEMIGRELEGETTLEGNIRIDCRTFKPKWVKQVKSK